MIVSKATRAMEVSECAVGEPVLPASIAFWIRSRMACSMSVGSLGIGLVSDELTIHDATANETIFASAVHGIKPPLLKGAFLLRPCRYF